MKTLIKKIIENFRLAQRAKKISKIINKLLFEINDDITRKKIKNKLIPLFGHNLDDVTTPEAVDNGFIVFNGYNPKTKKTLILTISTYEKTNKDDCGCGKPTNKKDPRIKNILKKTIKKRSLLK
jgi:ribosomal protein L23